MKYTKEYLKENGIAWVCPNHRTFADTKLIPCAICGYNGDQPVRVQRKRSKGWTMPENTVYVGRPSKYGNPYRISTWGKLGSVAAYRAKVVGEHRLMMTIKEELKGKNLSCWCPLDQPCHADILLEIANK